jgi:hypothetical protein
VAPVSRLQIMIGRTLGGATVAMIQGLLVTVICQLAGFRQVHWLTIPIALGFMVLIADFGRQYRKVEVVLLEEPSQGIEPLTDWLRTGTIDLALVELSAHGLKVTPLIDDERLAIVSRGSAFARRKRLSVGRFG